jgi:hypothetical protein
MSEGDAEISRIHLTCIRAAERPAMDGRAEINLGRMLRQGWLVKPTNVATHE